MSLSSGLKSIGLLSSVLASALAVSSTVQAGGCQLYSGSSTCSGTVAPQTTTHAMGMTFNSIAQGAANEAVMGFFGGPEPFVTGRIRATSHDGFNTSSALGTGFTNPTNIKESSVFASGAYSLPGTFIGASVRLTGVVGETFLSAEQNPLPLSGLSKGQIAGSYSTATFFGGSALLAWKTGWYAVGTAIGFFGSTDVHERVTSTVFSYDTRGWTGNLTVGTVVPLPWLGSGVKLDLRGSAGYTGFEGDTYQVINNRFTSSLSMFTGSFQPMLFADIPMNGGTLRPYLQGTVKGLGSYDNALKVQQTDGPFAETARYLQHGTYFGAEIGFNYGVGNWTFGTSLYTEQSRSEETYGAKIGASVKLN